MADNGHDRKTTGQTQSLPSGRLGIKGKLLYDARDRGTWRELGAQEPVSQVGSPMAVILKLTHES